jgi:Recombinase
VTTKDVAPIVAQLRAEGASLRQIAEGLNARGIPAPKGREVVCGTGDPCASAHAAHWT